MASGGSPSTGRLGAGAGAFGFGSDDVLCSYDDLVSEDNANESRSGSAGKETGERKFGRPPAVAYSQREGHNKQDVVFAIEKCFNKYTDNLLSLFEGINGRLSQLLDHCYNLERSMGDLRSDLSCDQKESDSKYKSLEKHLVEVHRSVQIMRDKQELVETQRELTKLQLSQKDSSDSFKKKMDDDLSGAGNQELALVVHQQPAQVAQQSRSPDHYQSSNEPPVQQSLPSSFCIQQVPQTLSQGGAFPPQQNQFPSQPLVHQHKEPPVQQSIPSTFLPQQNQLPSQSLLHQQTTALQHESRFAPQRSQIQNLSGQQPPVFSRSQSSTFPQYQQQWSQPTSRQFPPQAVQQQVAPQTQFQLQGAVHPSYPSQQPPTKVTTEAYPAGAPIPTSNAVNRQSTGTHQEAMRFGYGGQGGSAMQLPPTSQIRCSLMCQTPQGTSHGLMMGPPQPHCSGYAGAASFPPQSSTNGHVMYGNGGVRTGYPAGGHQNQHATSRRHPGEQPMRGHPHGELIENAVRMGFARGQVAKAIYGMEENGRSIHFDALLDVLNSCPSTSATARGW